MKRRLYFLLPTVNHAKTIHNELLLARIEERNMHVLARDDISLDDLPEASLLEKSDLIHGLQLGFIIGGFTGIALAMTAYLTSMIVPGWETASMSGIIVGCAFIGSWTSSMVAVNVQNTRLKEFMKDVNSGKILYMVDVPVHRIDEISDLVQSNHPDVSVRGVEHTIPAFP
ncbi:MAG: DUF1269 domain-containing protein [Gammaproteobacteria bacterium]|nr:DUF1269 domain-containing protein [Gammaproteobacteria bacterium]MCW8988255.1 DUF1269 domain-containing protein [Gammaproteobacteria bacterium]MCW9032213.1 DUF1269 domain-containing protein [Gammaproteobacteria bacterium]